MTLLTSPALAMAVGYATITVFGVTLLALGAYSSTDEICPSHFFSVSPPISFFGWCVSNPWTYALIHLFYLFHQLANNYINTVVYPWIINEIQDPKAVSLTYTKRQSLIMINAFDLYSEIDLVIILMGFTSKLTFVLAVCLANLITSTSINSIYIDRKRRRGGGPDVDLEQGYGSLASSPLN